MALSPEEIRENEWVNDREWVKVYNVKYPNDRIPVEVNGIKFTITPREAIYLPKAAIGVLKSAIHMQTEAKATAPGEQRKVIPFNRFEVVPCSPPTVIDEEYKKPEGRPKNIVKETRKQNEMKQESDDFITDVLPEVANVSS